MNNTITITLTVFATIVFMGGMLLLMNHALTLNEIDECVKWQRYADIYPGFYVTSAEKAQCDYLGIEVVIPES